MVVVAFHNRTQNVFEFAFEICLQDILIEF